MARDIYMTAPTSSLRDRLLEARDRLVSKRSFQRWAAKFPLTRPIARQRTRALFDICSGFVYSQVLLACVRLGLFDLLFEAPRTAPELARLISLPEEATERLLRAAISLRLVSRRGSEHYGLGTLGAAVVGNPGIAAMVEHNALLYMDLQDPVALLRRTRGDGTQLSSYWSYATDDALTEDQVDRMSAYSRLMGTSQPLVADEIMDSYPLDKHRWLLDVGGGNGSFLIQVAERFPKLRLSLFDLPPVAKEARYRFSSLGLSDRANAFGGDFLSEPLPTGPDIVSLVRIIHDHDDEPALRILRAIRNMLPEDGHLLLAEPMAGTPGAEPAGDAYFGFYLMAMGRGRPRTPAELVNLLHAAGFGSVSFRRTSTPLLVRVILARP